MLCCGVLYRVGGGRCVSGVLYDGIVDVWMFGDGVGPAQIKQFANLTKFLKLFKKTLNHKKCTKTVNPKNL